jgi:hypothetical protein
MKGSGSTAGKLKRRIKISLTAVAIVLALFMAVNLPIIEYSTCNYTLHESYLSSLHHICDGFETLDAMQPDLQAGVTASANTTATSSLTIPINNGSCSSYIQAITLSGANLTSTISEWSAPANSNRSIDLYSANSSNMVAACSTTTLTFYPISSSDSPQSITAGKTINYLIVFANGDSISGYVVAQ